MRLNGWSLIKQVELLMMIIGTDKAKPPNWAKKTSKDIKRTFEDKNVKKINQ